MWKGISSFANKVYVLNVCENEYLSLDLSCFRYQSKTNSFHLSSRKTQQFNTVGEKAARKRPRKEVTYLGFKILLDHHCGVYYPFLIMQIDDKCFFFCLHNLRWFIKYSFQVQQQIKGEERHISHCDHFNIVNGPSLIWIDKTTVHVYKAEYSHSNSTDCLHKLSVEHEHSAVSGKILWWKSTNDSGNTSSDTGMIIFEEGNCHKKGYLVNLENTKCSIKLTSVIPELYLSIMTSCCVQPLPLSNNILITTNQRQLLEFCDGQYIRHLSIPLPQCETTHYFQSANGDSILVCSQESDIVVVNWDIHQIIRKWSGYSGILIDDFFGNGMEQILFFSDYKHGRENSVFQNYILTDFNNNDIFSTEKSRDGGVNKKKEQNSVYEVINALKQKVKDTETMLTEDRIAKFEKISFVKKHCNVLQDIVMMRQPEKSCESPGNLGNLLVGSRMANDNPEKSQKSSMLMVLSKSQQFHDSKWIIILIIKNVSGSKLSDISLGVIAPCFGKLVSSSKVFSMSESEVSLPVNRKGLLPERKAILVCITDVPDCSNEKCFTADLMMSYKTEHCHYAQCVDKITFKIEDILESNDENNVNICPALVLASIETTIAFSNAVNDQNECCYRIKSKMAVCGCRPVTNNYTSFTGYHLPTSLLDFVHVGINDKAPYISIATRDYSQLYHTLWRIKRLLPDNVTWTSGHSLMNITEHLTNRLHTETNSRINKLCIILRRKPLTAEDTTNKEDENIITKQRPKFCNNTGDPIEDIKYCDCGEIFSYISLCVSVTEQDLALLCSCSQI